MAKYFRKTLVLIIFCLFLLIAFHRKPSQYFSTNRFVFDELTTFNTSVLKAFPAFSQPEDRNFTVSDVLLGTAFSKNHFAEALRSCISMKKHRSMTNLIDDNTIKVIAFNMGGLSPDDLSTYAKHCPFVEVRDLDFSNYPAYVADLMQYRWKPLIIAELLNIKPVVFYLDTSVVFMNSSKDTFEDLVSSLNDKYVKCGIGITALTEHSIVAATHPGIYKFFNNDTLNYVASTKMVTATTYLATRRTSGIRTMRKVVECALTKECMAPTGAEVKCNHEKIYTPVYANCHRYDQSALALALLECTSSVEDYYSETDLFDMQRRDMVIDFWKRVNEKDVLKYNLGDIKSFYMNESLNEII